MAILRISPPLQLERAQSPQTLQEGEAFVAQWIDTTTWPGRLRRGPGCTQLDRNFVAGVSTTILGAGVFTRRDCRKLLVDQDSAGNLRATQATTYGYITPPCCGPLPQIEDNPEDENGIQNAYGSEFPDRAAQNMKGNGQIANAANPCTGVTTCLPTDLEGTAPCLNVGDTVSGPCNTCLSCVGVFLVTAVVCKDAFGAFIACNDPACDHVFSATSVFQMCKPG